MAEPEPTFEPEPESTAESEVEPETEPAPEVEPEAYAWPEPEPEWSYAFKEWGAAWPLHIYLFGICYALAFVLAVVCICSVIKSVKAGKGKLTVSLLLMVMFFNLTRALSLFAEPYYAFNNIPFLTARLIWSVGLPFLTSSFSLVFLVLLDTTKMDVGPPKFQKFSAILMVTGFHLVIVITTDAVVFYKPSAKVMLVICQTLFMIYGLVLAVGYFYVGIKMKQNCAAGAMHDSGAIYRMIKLCYVSSVTSLTIVATHLYSAIKVFNVYSTDKNVPPWPWWILQTFLRVEELVSMAVVLVIASNSEHLRTLFRDCCRPMSRVQTISIQQETWKNTTSISTKRETLSKNTKW